MQKKEEVLESFKTAIKSTIKSISNKDNIEISFGGQDVSNENNKYIHNYNTRKNAQIKRYINEINIARDRFMKEVKNALYLLRELNKKYPMVPPGMWI